MIIGVDLTNLVAIVEWNTNSKMIDCQLEEQ